MCVCVWGGGGGGVYCMYVCYSMDEIVVQPLNTKHSCVVCITHISVVHLDNMSSSVKVL